MKNSILILLGAGMIGFTLYCGYIMLEPAGLWQDRQGEGWIELTEQVENTLQANELERSADQIISGTDNAQLKMLSGEEQSDADSQSGHEPEEMTNTSNSDAIQVNINTATADELDELPGIGPSKARAIVEYRLQHGDFTSIESVTSVKGIGEKTFENFKKFITIQ